MSPNARSASPGWRSRLETFLAWDATRSLPGLFLILGCPLGVLFAFLVPPLQVPDEVWHFYRAYGVSEGSCVAPVAQTVPASVRQLQERFPGYLERVRRVGFREYLTSPNTSPDPRERCQVRAVSANIYNCAPYLVSAAAIASAKLSSQLPLVQLFAARLANLAFYLALVYIALGILPIARLTLFCLALMPMTLHQAASVSADSAGFASAFLLFAYVAYLAFDPRLETISTRQWMIAGLLLLFAALCKFNLWLVLLLLLIPSARTGTLKKKLAMVAVAGASVLLASALWQVVNQANLAAFAAARAALDIFPQENFAFVTDHPIEFLYILLRTLRIEWLNYALNFVGTLGWLTIVPPAGLVISWIGMLLLTALVATEVRITAAQRAVCILVVGGSALFVFVALWTIEMRGSRLVDSILASNGGTVPGVQGRYFIPFAPVALLALSTGKWRLKPSIAVTCCTALVLIAAAISLRLVWKAYY